MTENKQDETWLIVCTRHKSYIPGALLFWGGDCKGYTHDIHRAGRYTKEFVKRIQENSHGEDYGLLESDVRAARSTCSVDHSDMRQVLEAKNARQ